MAYKKNHVAYNLQTYDRYFYLQMWNLKIGETRELQTYEKFLLKIMANREQQRGYS